MFARYIHDVFEEILTDAMPTNFIYSNSSIVNIKRLYPIEMDDELTNRVPQELNS